MKSRRWLPFVATCVLVALVIPPVFFWYYEGPRTSRIGDAEWRTFMRHSGEESVELSRAAPNAPPTRSELQAASRLLNETTENASAFSDYGHVTTHGGFTVSNTAILGRPTSMFHHLFNPSNMADGATLDPKRPESLVFMRAGEQMQLVGVMFMMPPGVRGAQPGGSLTQWHYHPTVEFCMDSIGVPVSRAARGNDGGCAPGTTNGPTPEMLHVWQVDNPFGAFAHQMAVAGHSHGASDHEMNPYAKFARRTSLWVQARLGDKRSLAEPEPAVVHAQHADSAKRAPTLRTSTGDVVSQQHRHDSTRN